jgi:Ran GTPase-activating protein (RanGAP) involved in mRNA processing and transport
MSSIPSLAPGKRSLHLHEISNVENLPERIEEIAQAIGAHPTLTSITAFSNRDIEDPRIFNAVTSNSNIKELCFYLCGLDSQMLVRILRMPSLENLQLSSCHFDDVESAARAIQSHGRKLKEFKCTGLTDNGHGDVVATAVAKSLRFRSSLAKLDLSRCGLSQEGLGAIANVLRGHTSLEKISIAEQGLVISPDIAEAVALAIEQNSTLTEFSLRLGSPVQQRLLQALARNKTLVEADFGIITLGHDVSQLTLPGVIGHNSTLKRLTFRAPRSDQGDDRTVTSNMIGPILSQFDAFHSLSSVHLFDWEFSTDGLEAVCNKLAQVQSVESLGLSGMRFDSEKTRILCHFLSNNTSLVELEMAECPLDDAETASLCMALKQNQALKKLSLHPGHLGNRSLIQLAELIEGNSTLENLSLWFDDDDDQEDAVRFGEALKKNTSLKSLYWIDLGRQITERGSRSLREGLKHHQKLALFMIGDINATQSQEDEIFFYNVRNRRLRPLLSAQPPLPIGLWPRVLHRASTISRRNQNANLNFLHFLVKENCHLFQRANDRDEGNQSKPIARKRNRTRNVSEGRRRKRRRR